MTGVSGLDRRRAREGQLAILVAAVAWSTAGLAQRELDASPATQVAGRAVFAGLALFALVVATERRGTLAAFRSMGRSGLAMAVFLAISSGAFLLALNSTSVANVLFMQAAAPMMAALLGWALLHERDRRPDVDRARCSPAVGVAVMAAGSFDAGAAAVGLPFLMTVSFAARDRDRAAPPGRVDDARDLRLAGARRARVPAVRRARDRRATATGRSSPRSASARWASASRS